MLVCDCPHKGTSQCIRCYYSNVHLGDIPPMSLAADNRRLRDVLEKLARLGNGDHYGNSDGNRIAQQALKEVRP